MKIGILTVPFNNNYGGMLQAFALKTVLNAMGHETVFINRRRNRPRTIKFKLYHTLVKIGLLKDRIKQNDKRLSKYTDLFLDQYLSPITKDYYTSTEIRACLELGLDIIIVGSDQVWRYRYAKDAIFDYFLEFADNVKKISYAASFGVDTCEYPVDIRERIRDLLCKFDHISVREVSGKKIIEKDLNYHVDRVNVVLDPTLLLPSECYSELLSPCLHKEKYIFTYVLDEDSIKESDISSIQNKYNLSRLDFKAQSGSSEKQKVIEPVEKWLSGIANSEYVITDSFHGTVFSIIFNKPFIVVANPDRGITRLLNLLQVFNLQDRLITSMENDYLDILNRSIQWEMVNDVLAKSRTESLNYLKNALI